MYFIRLFLKFIIYTFFVVFFNFNATFAEQKISKILIEGNQRVDNETILSFISLSEGSSYIDSDLNIILKDLYKTENIILNNISHFHIKSNKRY